MVSGEFLGISSNKEIGEDPPGRLRVYVVAASGCSNATHHHQQTAVRQPPPSRRPPWLRLWTAAVGELRVSGSTIFSRITGYAGSRIFSNSSVINPLKSGIL
jgi:hypothetical protein